MVFLSTKYLINLFLLFPSCIHFLASYFLLGLLILSALIFRLLTSPLYYLSIMFAFLELTLS